MEDLLATKLYIPRKRPVIVPRSRLIERLNQGLHRKLTLLTAPAGFGKTTLINEWVDHLRPERAATSQAEYKIAWLSLDKGDNDSARFLAYLIAALNLGVDPATSIGKATLNLLQSPQPPPAEAVLISLINEVTAVPDHIVLILDDYHLIETETIHKALTYLIEHLPPTFHLVIASRIDPDLPLARLRARNELNELRAADLRFTFEEAAEFLNQVMGLNLLSEDIATLETRTEGWIAGLHLAAISMQRHEDTTKFIETFSGSHRLVLDYLVEEILDQQTEPLQNFLLKTSVLDRLNSSLCNALTGQDDSQAILEMLERGNLFIVPLDDERRWYRYHHLFADLLRQRLNQRIGSVNDHESGELTDLHFLASTWYEQNNFVGEAVDHALATQDFGRAANLIDEHVDVVWGRGELNTLIGWIGKLPDEIAYTRPRLCIFHSWVLFVNGQYQAAEQCLQAADHLIEDISTRERKYLSDDNATPDFQELSIKGKMAAIQAFISFFRGDVSSLDHFSHQALDNLPDESLLWRSMATITLGAAYRLSGNAVAAGSAFDEAIPLGQESDSTYLTLIAMLNRVVIYKEQGHLYQAAELCQQALSIASKMGMLEVEIGGWIYAELGDVQCEWNEMDEAMHHSKKGVELTEGGNDIAALGRSWVVLVRALYAQGDVKGALDLVQKVERFSQQTDVPPWVTHPIAAWKTRLLITGGDLDAAVRWTLERGLNVEDSISYLYEIDYLSLARLLLAQGNADEGVTLLNRLLQAAEAGGRMGNLIEILLLQALAHQSQNNLPLALVPLKRALVLAEPEGYLRLFVDEGPLMGRLLYEALTRGISPEYVQKLLGAFPVVEPKQVAAPQTQSPEAILIEPLSDRELEVLQLLAEGLANKEIAARLYLSLHTVKVHARNIFSKLGVNNRAQAGAKARALGILPPE